MSARRGRGDFDEGAIRDDFDENAWFSSAVYFRLALFDFEYNHDHEAETGPEPDPNLAPKFDLDMAPGADPDLGKANRNQNHLGQVLVLTASRLYLFSCGNRQNCCLYFILSLSLHYSCLFPHKRRWRPFCAFLNPDHFAVIDDVPSTTDFSTPTADVTTSFTTTTAVVTFTPIQISGTPTSIPVTQIVQSSSNCTARSVPVAVMAAPVSAVVILVLLLIGFVFHRSRRSASQPAFDFLLRAPATEPAQRLPFKEVTVLPPIPTMGGWGEAFSPAHDPDDPFANPDSMPRATRLTEEAPRGMCYR
ncbi:hypothetical protein EDB85DRAFT_2144914 [Lactarius pseudohatsudake]|nr:hypothetical protein EDB85DRAFT_2144914 [Lactarius pseudohatsudake]